MRLSDWKERAGQLKREVYALYLCSRHPRTPLGAKLLAVVIVSYAMSPIDLIPDFVPVLGYVDDLVLIPLGIALLVKIMPRDVLEECRTKAGSIRAERPVRWIGIVLVIAVWAIVLYGAYRIAARFF